MSPFEFDVSVLFDLQKLVQDSEIAWVNKDLYRNKEGFVCVWKLVDGKNRIRLPFAICDYFGVKYNFKIDCEYIWEKVEDIKYQILLDLANSMSNGIYKLDWDDHKSLCLFAFIKV